MKIKVILIVTSLLHSLIGFSQPSSEANWQKDLTIYHQGLEANHIDLYNKISEHDFNLELQKIRSSLSEKKDIGIILDLMRLTRKIGDGHTSVSLQNLDRHVYPIRLDLIEGKWRVVQVAEKYKSLMGYELKEIDGKPMNLIARQVSEVAQFVENKHSLIIRQCSYLLISEIMHGLGISKEERSAQFTFEKEGKTLRMELHAEERDQFYKNNKIISIDFSVPQIRKPAIPQHENLWFSPIKGTKAVYIKFGHYPSFEDMDGFSQKVLNYINSHSCKELIIDLRNNGGGDFFIGLVMAANLNLADSINWKSGVYVLTDKGTFSAATSNASQFRQILNGKIVGEPTGSNPTGYQDMDRFELPHSGLVITYSKRLFRFQEKVTEGIIPDVLLEYKWESIFNGKDNMLEWVLKDIER